MTTLQTSLREQTENAGAVEERCGAILGALAREDLQEASNLPGMDELRAAFTSSTVLGLWTRIGTVAGIAIQRLDRLTVRAVCTQAAFTQVTLQKAAGWEQEAQRLEELREIHWVALGGVWVAFKIVMTEAGVEASSVISVHGGLADITRDMLTESPVTEPDQESLNLFRSLMDPKGYHATLN